MVTLELTDEELTAVRVALVGLVHEQSVGPTHDSWKRAATGILQRIVPLEDRT